MYNGFTYNLVGRISDTAVARRSLSAVCVQQHDDGCHNITGCITLSLCLSAPSIKAAVAELSLLQCIMATV